MDERTALTWVSGPGTPTKVFVTRVLTFGTLHELRAMFAFIPKDQILDAVEHPLRGEWTPHGKSFAECIFDCTLPDDVLISYEV